MTPFQRLFSTLTNPWVATIYWGFIAISFIYFDLPVAKYLHQLDLRHNFPLLNWLTKLGIGGIYFVGFFLLGLFFRYVYPKKQWEYKAWFLWFCVVIPSTICLFLKVTLGRARPGLYFDDQLYGFYWLQKNAPFWSFPSGHTTNIMGLVFGLSIIFPRFGYYFIVPGFCITLTRVLLTHHYLSDVLAAAYLAMLEIGLFYIWLKRKYWLIARTCY
ncbi:phosphatase PAP2 family protein [Legionella londiniensis]|uniref:Phosphatidylglycerophosphatase B n=1 Tax=Legionella londiniensis TaxID=45068 RepID=A0A0W0VMT1_9GAMM|nr:phosphatase PAP2 family protein [Legionella londiniensis]KTD21375.1 phosphatidylglycerophosphatase B [Legionella londiniensis]STX93568.1 phosphatidylglycerophosphatase B [Legionella londiniensis]